MRRRKPYAIFIITSASALLIGCTSSSNDQTSQDLDKVVRDAAAKLPRRIDAATTLIEVRSDGQGGVVYVDSGDTSMVQVPPLEELKHKLCDVGADSHVESRNPWSEITYIYRDLRGNELVRLHFGRGECPGQAL